jgi:hypothetical protein
MTGTNKLDEFTEYRLRSIGQTFAKIYKARGRKAGSLYLNRMNIQKEHYPIVRHHIDYYLDLEGLKL